MCVLHTITLFHATGFRFEKLLKTAQKHEIRRNNIQRDQFFYVARNAGCLHYKDQPVSALWVHRFLQFRVLTRLSSWA
jgi:hypothetical protein